MIESEIKNPIPTNIITGFLGVGKTTAIQNLIAKKPQNERWAVLVNEFGEVGIDGNLFEGMTESQNGVTISQVPGGCMCCANGFPIQIALGMLLAKSNAQRLLIEPTGLSHPKEVISMLSRNYYREILELRATVSLVDARKIKDRRFTANETFNQQLEVAEIIIANKADLYESGDFPSLLTYIEENFDLGSKSIYQVQHGALDKEWLEQPTTLNNLTPSNDKPAEEQASFLPANLQTPTEGFRSVDNSGEGFFSRGWIFNPSWLFGVNKLRSAIQGLEVERLKGVFITSDGFIAFNKSDSIVTQTHLDRLEDSRVEVISGRTGAMDGIEEALLDCLVQK